MKKLLALLLMAALVLGCVPAMADYVLVEGQNAEGLFGNPLQAIQVAFVKQVDEEATDKSAGFPYAAFQVFGLTNAEVRTFMRAQDGPTEGGTIIAVLTEDGKVVFIITNDIDQETELEALMHTYTDPNNPPVMNEYRFVTDEGTYVVHGEAFWHPAEEGDEPGMLGMWVFRSLGMIDDNGDFDEFEDPGYFGLPIWEDKV